MYYCLHFAYMQSVNSSKISHTRIRTNNGFISYGKLYLFSLYDHKVLSNITNTPHSKPVNQLQ